MNDLAIIYVCGIPLAFAIMMFLVMDKPKVTAKDWIQCFFGAVAWPLVLFITCGS